MDLGGKQCVQKTGKVCVLKKGVCVRKTVNKVRMSVKTIYKYNSRMNSYSRDLNHQVPVFLELYIYSFYQSRLSSVIISLHSQPLYINILKSSFCFFRGVYSSIIASTKGGGKESKALRARKENQRRVKKKGRKRKGKEKGKGKGKEKGKGRKRKENKSTKG